MGRVASSRKIVHVELNGAPLPTLEADPRFEGLHVVFWCDGVPVAQRALHGGDLPLTAEQVAGVLLDAAAEAPRRGVVTLRPDALPPRLRERLATECDPAGEAPSPHSVSVVICTRDRAESLARCLGSLQAMPAAPGEILVVDNAPTTDATRRLVASMPGVRYVLEPRAGLDVARNTGIRTSKGEVVAFTDDDVTVHPRWLERLLQGFRDPLAMAVTGLVLPAELDTEAQVIFETHWSFNRGYHRLLFDRRFFDRTCPIGVPVWEIGAGANMAFRRRIFELVGDFDERLDVGAAGCSGDSELWYRILADGWHCRYEPASVVFHYHRRTADGLKRQIRAYMRGHVASLLVQFEKHGHRGNVRRVFVSLPKSYVRALLFGLLFGFDRRHRTLVPEVSGCLSGLLFYLRHRRPRVAPPIPAQKRGQVL